MERLSVYDEWMKDPEFKALPANDKALALYNFFEREMADDEFRALPEQDQSQVRNNFLDTHVGIRRPGIVLGEKDEAAFRNWYLDKSKKLNLDPNPDAKEHYYDYRSAFKSGAEPDETGHWPSKFKLAGHPRLIIDGVDTRKEVETEQEKTMFHTVDPLTGRSFFHSGEFKNVQHHVAGATKQALWDVAAGPSRMLHGVGILAEKATEIAAEDTSGIKSGPLELRGMAISGSYTGLPRDKQSDIPDKFFPWLKSIGEENKAFFKNKMLADPDIQAFNKSVSNETEGFWTEAIGSGGHTVSGLVMALIPVVGPAMSGAMFLDLNKEEIYEQTKPRLLKAGFSEEEAEKKAQAVSWAGGAINSLLDLTGVDFMADAIKRKAGQNLIQFLIGVGTSTAVEGGTEGFQGVIARISEEWAAKPADETVKDFTSRMAGNIPELWKIWKHDAAIGAAMGGAVTVAGGGARKAYQTIFDKKTSDDSEAPPPPPTSDPTINEALQKGARAAIENDPIMVAYKTYIESGKATAEGLRALLQSLPPEHPAAIDITQVLATMGEDQAPEIKVDLSDNTGKGEGGARERAATEEIAVEDMPGNIAEEVQQEEVAEGIELREDAILPPADTLWDKELSRLMDYWGQASSHVEEIKISVVPRLKAIEEELAAIKGKRDKVSVAKRKELNEDRANLKSLGDAVLAAYESQNISEIEALADSAVEKAKEKGLPEDLTDDFRERFSLEISEERPYIEANYNKKISQIFDEVFSGFQEQASMEGVSQPTEEAAVSDDFRPLIDEARSFGAEYRGVGRAPGGGEMLLFNDPETGSTFTVRKGQSVVDRMQENRAGFGKWQEKPDRKTEDATGVPDPDTVPIADIFTDHSTTKEVAAAEKRKLKSQVVDGIKDGSIPVGGAVRFGTVDELISIIEAGAFNTDTFAQPVLSREDEAFSAYGDYDKHNMAIVFPAGHVQGQDGKSVRIKPDASLGEIRVLINGHKKAYTIEELRNTGKITPESTPEQPGSTIEKKPTATTPEGEEGGGIDLSKNTGSGESGARKKASEDWRYDIKGVRKKATELGLKDEIYNGTEYDWGDRNSIIRAIENKLAETTTEDTEAGIIQEIAEISDDALDELLATTGVTETEAGNTGEQEKAPSPSEVSAKEAEEGKAAKSLDSIVADISKEGVKGAGEALEGLYELFGGASMKSFPGGIDKDTYLKAKPHFEAALDHFVKAGKGLQEFASTIVKQFGDAIKPYLKLFIQEKRDGTAAAETEEPGKEADLSDNTGKGEKGGRKKAKLFAEEKEAGKKAAEEKKKEREEKKKKKAALGEFTNVGFVYDPEKLNKQIADKPTKTAVKIILDQMTPSKVWGKGYADNATPGLVRLHDDFMKNSFYTFKEALENELNKVGYYPRRVKSIEAKIERWISRYDSSVDDLKAFATKYGEAIQPVIDCFKDQSEIAGAIGRLQYTLVPDMRNEDGTWKGPLQWDTDPFSDAMKRPRMVYAVVTEAWAELLQAENDIFLSEIDINKRGKNEAVVRIGLPDYREGVELKKTEDFQKPFNFNGVGFGETGWINQEERNRVVPAAFDAFKDLAATIGAPDIGMSLGGQLAVQFANLGHKAKGSAAAYFPDVKTINFTRDNGDGTTAHEWGHAFDYLITGDVSAELGKIIESFHYFYDFEAGKQAVNDLLAKDSAFLKRLISSKKQSRIEAVKERVAEIYEETVRKRTHYYKVSMSLDPDYTARQSEMWARALEAFVYDSLEGINNYLVNDFVSAGRVGGKSSVGDSLVYPAGKERETFNESIKTLFDGLAWDEDGIPSLKDDYVPIENRNEEILIDELNKLLDEVETRYKAIWASEPSSDGLYWYQYTDTAFGPMMQPDGYTVYDKEFKGEEQIGTGAVAYLTQLHPDDIIDYNLENIQYSGDKAKIIAEGGGFSDSVQGNGETTLGEVSAGEDSGAEGGRVVGERPRPSGGDGDGGAPGPGKERGAIGSSEGDSVEGVHTLTPGNFRITDPTLNDPKNIDARFNMNLAAVKLLHSLEEENRQATPGEKEILSKYSGWGGLAETFSYYPSDKWKRRSELIRDELTADELKDAEASSTTSYYTPIAVSDFMWRLAQRLGFKGGVVLDPATGANGTFFGTLPADLSQSTTFQGVEMDTLSHRIASKLYELATIENNPFQGVSKPRNRYNLSMTNVPFEDLVPTDKKHNKGKHKLHNYFINKMIDLTAPGSLVMAITSARTLDSSKGHLAEYAEKADLVGAIRLPSGIYSATDVSTDILVFRKKIEGSKFEGIPAEDWTTLVQDPDSGLMINNYFLRHPDMIAGTLGTKRGRWGAELHVTPSADSLSNTLDNIAAAFPADIVEGEIVKELQSIDDIIAAPGTVKEGGIYINDKGVACWKLQGKEIAFPTKTPAEKKKAEIAKGFVGLLDQVRKTLRSQRLAEEESAIKANQVKLKKLYDSFVKKFGPINKPEVSNVFLDATDSAWVLALEKYDLESEAVERLADIFTKTVTGPEAKPTRADTDSDALMMSLNEFGFPNLDYMAKLRVSDVETVMAGVADKVIENPETGFLETVDEYLSGNIRHKLNVAKEMAEANPEYEHNVALLESALPSDIPADRISVRIGASWIKPEHLSDYINEKMKLRDVFDIETVVEFNPVTSSWLLSYKGTSIHRGYSNYGEENKTATRRNLKMAKDSVEAKSVWGTEGKNFFELMECALSGKAPEVTYKDPLTGKRFLDPVETRGAEAKLREIQTDFAAWMFGDMGRAKEAVDRFNELVNTSVPIKSDGSHLTFPGKSQHLVTAKEKEALGDVTDIREMYPHQANAVWKYVRHGNSYLAHEVGAGKTATMALIAMEAKRLKGKRKVLYVTLNDSTMGQAITEIKELYPLANVMPVKVSQKKERQRLQLQKITMNDFDIAIMRQQDLNVIALSPTAEREFIEEELNELRETLEEAKASGAKITESDIQTRIKQLEEKLKAGVREEAKSKNVYFDDLGIDLVIVDEAHSYKNVPYSTVMKRVVGLNPAGSKTARDFFRKTQYLNKMYPKNDAIVLASGTPLTNSIAELYNIQRMLQPQEVKRGGVWSFDRWIGNYGETGHELEWDGARQSFKTVVKISRVVNAGRLLATASQVLDVVRVEDTPIVRPEVRDGEPARVIIEPNQYVKDYNEIVLERCMEIASNPKGAEYEGIPDNMLRVIGDMSKIAIDQRLDHHYADTEMQKGSKIAIASKKIYDIWKQEAKHKGVQLVFCDRGVPGRYEKSFKKKSPEELEAMSPEGLAEYRQELLEAENAATGNFNVYDGLKVELVKMGIPAKEIAFIHDADHSNKRKKQMLLEKLYKRVNKGEARVLIGSTKKAGTGVNVQERVCAIHHLDVWWNYSDWEQRNGRGIRAGNIYAEDGMPGAYIFNYSTKYTVDGTRWSKIFSKGKVLNAVLSGNINMDVFEDITENTVSANMMTADISGNPDFALQASLMQEVLALRSEMSAHLNTAWRAKTDLGQIPGKIEVLKNDIKNHQRSLGVVEKITAVKFVGDNRTLVFAKHGKEIAEAIQKAVDSDKAPWGLGTEKPLLVFGSHTESEVEKKGGGKEKVYNFSPIPVTANLAARLGAPFERWFKVQGGGILPVQKYVGAVSSASYRKADKTKVEVNISRTVTEYKTRAEGKIESNQKEIDKLEADIPKLEQVVNTPWPKQEHFAAKQAELDEVNVRLEAFAITRGAKEGYPETGIDVSKYEGSFPYLSNIHGEWYRYRDMLTPKIGTGYDADAGYYPEIGLRYPGGVKLKKYSRPPSPIMVSQVYGPKTGAEPEILEGRPPHRDPVKPIAYTVTDGKTLFWFPLDNGRFASVRADVWRAADKFVGDEGTWRFEDRGSDNDQFLIHSDKDGSRDCFVRVDVTRDAPEGVARLAGAAPTSTQLSKGAATRQGEEIAKLREANPASLEQLKKDVLGWLHDVLPKSAINRLRVELAPNLSMEGRDVSESENQWSEMGGNSEYTGASTTGALGSFIEISYNYDSDAMQETVYHEAFHVAMRWLLPEADVGVVMRHFGSNEEAAANAFASFCKTQKIRTGKQLPGKVKMAFYKLRRLLQMIRNALQGKGFARPEDVFARLWDGQYEVMPETRRRQRIEDLKGGARLDKAGVNEVQFRKEFGYGPTDITQATIQQYLLNGARGIDGLRSRIPPAGSRRSTEETPGISKQEQVDTRFSKKTPKTDAELYEAFMETLELVAGPEFVESIKTEAESADPDAMLPDSNETESQRKARLDNTDKTLRSVKKAMSDRFGKGYADETMKWYHAAFGLPYWLGKKFKSINTAVNIEVSAAETRSKMLHRDYDESGLGDIQRETLKDKKATQELENLIWKWDRVRFPKTAVPSNWHKEIKKGEDIEIDPAHYEQIEKYLKGQGVSDKATQSFLTIRKKLDEKFVDIDSLLRRQDDDPDLITEFRSEINKVHNYFPHKRTGDSHVTVIDPKRPKGKKTLYREHYYSIKDRVLPVKKKAKTRAEQWLAEQIESGALSGNVEDYKVIQGKVQQLPDEVFFQIPVEAMQQIAAEAGRKLEETRAQYEAERLYNKEKAATHEEALKVAEQRLHADMERALSSAMATVFKSRGWARHSILSKNIPGHDKGDVFGTLFDYLTGYAGFKTKMDRARQHSKNLQAVNAKESPTEYKYLSDYVRDMLANQDKVDRAVDMLRGAFFVKYLGFVVKSGIVNLTQNVVLAAPTLSIHTKGPTFKLTKAMVDVRKALTSKAAWSQKSEVKYPGLKEEEQQAIHELIESGTAIDQFLREIKGSLPSVGIIKGMQAGMDYAGIFMMLAEKFNRTSTGLAAFRVARNEKGMGFDDAIAFAKQIVYDSHFLYGKANYPSLVRGNAAAKMLRSAYTFRSFTANYLNAIADMLSNKQYAAVARSLRNILLTGGLTSVPFFETLSRLLYWILGDDDDDPMTDVRKYIPSHLLKDMVVYGIPGLLGIDITGSLSVELPRGWSDLVGVPYAILEDTENMIKSVKAGNYSRAVSESPITPVVVRNAMRGYDLYAKGQRTRGGADINYFGQPGANKVTIKEAIQKGVLGLQPTSVSSGYKAYQATNRFVEGMRERKARLADRMANALRQKDWTKAKKIGREIDDWNKKAVKKKEFHKLIDISASVERRLAPLDTKGVPTVGQPRAAEIAAEWREPKRIGGSGR